MRWRMRTTRRDAHVKDDVPVGRRENFYGERRKGTRRRPDEFGTNLQYTTCLLFFKNMVHTFNMSLHMQPDDDVTKPNITFMQPLSTPYTLP